MQERSNTSGCGTGPRRPSPLSGGREEREAPKAAEGRAASPGPAGHPRHSDHRDASARRPRRRGAAGPRGRPERRRPGAAPASAARATPRPRVLAGPRGARGRREERRGRGRADAACGPRPKVRGRGQGPAGPRRVPRGADRAGPCRAAAALRAALGEGAERRRELERRAARSRALLRRWDDEEEERPQPQSGSSTEHEDRPSPKELEELELLNRALEKALKVRESILKTSLEAQRARGQKWAGEAHAPKKAEEQQVPVPVEDVPEYRKVRTGSKKPLLLKKPSPYQLRAPYRTDPDVKKLQRKVPARCVSQGPRTAGKIFSKAVTSKQGRSHRTATGATAREVCAAAEPQETPGLSESAPNEQQSFYGGDSAAGKNSTVAGKQLLDAGKKSCGFLGESSKKEDTAGARGRSASPGTGTLQEKGCQMKLPVPYRKAYSRNSRAWERCRLCRTSADAAAARTRFMERIQTTFEFCSPKLTPSPAEIEEELRGLQDVPSRLRQYVESEPADPSTLQEEYESLLTLEGLRTTVSQCLQKLQLLREALESQLRLCPDCTGDVGSCSPACVPARGQTCDSADMLAVPLLCYSSLQELRDLFALKLQVSMLHQEIALQKVMMAELLPVLEPRPLLEGSAGLFRAIHSQLCEGGRRFPVLVRDELLD
ncbi:tubulin epsilon and delta complex protein 2 [Motacilla alba alba]|uniref:tubulin epsilon and delta complex protein 2 n=1 Tax=Motacilla alba alba TaxID=1094192 RepID=UPI0018D5462C|nr:tubulin epsilon and delta complex protein 2 [Motacilla alba alba]